MTKKAYLILWILCFTLSSSMVYGENFIKSYHYKWKCIHCYNISSLANPFLKPEKCDGLKKKGFHIWQLRSIIIVDERKNNAA